MLLKQVIPNIKLVSKKYEGVTGFRSEPWHYRYVGVEAATYIHEHRNIPYEYYYAMFLDK